MSDIEYRWEFSRIQARNLPDAPKAISSVQMTVSAWENGVVGVFACEVRLENPDPDNFIPFPETPEEVEPFKTALKEWCLASLGRSEAFFQELALARLRENQISSGEVAFPEPLEDPEEGTDG